LFRNQVSHFACAVFPPRAQDFSAAKLAEQWGVSRQGVALMFNNAMKSENLYNEMRAAGYEDDEFPVWWFSPARDEVSPVKDAQVGEVRSQVTEVDEVLEEVPPRKPTPIEDDPQEAAFVT